MGFVGFCVTKGDGVQKFRKNAYVFCARSLISAIQIKMDELNRRNIENPAQKIDPDPNLLNLAKSCETNGLTAHDAKTGHSFDFSTQR
jgi:hypothetical protein